MRIAIVPNSVSSVGGAYQYSLAVLAALGESTVSARNNQYTLLIGSGREIEYLDEYRSRWGLTRLPISTRERLKGIIENSVCKGWLSEKATHLAYRLAPEFLMDPDRVLRNRTGRHFLEQLGIDWTFYTMPNSQSFEIGLPYVMPIHDLQHRLQPEFPEVSAHGAWEHREYLYRNGTRHATLILADSEIGKEDILEYYGSYGITSDRVKVLPYVPPPYLSRDVPQHVRKQVRETYRLPEQYLFYPAQFWPHKNHVRTVQALGLLKKQFGTEVHLVLCGTYSGVVRTREFEKMMREVKRLRLTQQIHYLGYVSNNIISSLYADAVALVIPTFFGPSNIPILEAWLFGCPVLTSEIRGIREQVGEAGLLVDPTSVEAIADGIRRLWEDEGLRAELSRRGTERLGADGPQRFSATLGGIIDEVNQSVSERTSRKKHKMVST